MRKLILFAFAVISFLLCACEKMEDPDLGKFQNWESYLDMSQKNQFDESLFCKEWDVDKVYREIYVDGKIKYKEDYTDAVIPWPNFVFNDDQTETVPVVFQIEFCKYLISRTKAVHILFSYLN